MFDGPAYDHKIDYEPLITQHTRIRDLMIDGRWRTLDEISVETGAPVASISAQLRHLRKPRFGSYVVNKRRRTHTRAFEYQLKFQDIFGGTNGSSR